MQFFMSQTKKCNIRLWQLEKSFQPELNYIKPILNQQCKLMLLFWPIKNHVKQLRLKYFKNKKEYEHIVTENDTLKIKFDNV